jgi:hypothetical protein
MSYPRREIDSYTVATTKLAQEWSSNRAVPHINSRWLEELLQDERFSSMDPIMKVRLLLSGLIAASQPSYQQQAHPEAAAELREALGQLQQAVAADADDWAKIMAAAAGNLDGRLDLDAVMQQSPVVRQFHCAVILLKLLIL